VTTPYGSAVAASLILLVAFGFACRKRPLEAPPEAGASDASAEQSDASAAMADAGAKTTEPEPASKPFACGDVLFVLGREWIEEWTSAATSTGSGG